MSREHVERRLAAILAGDVVGYSRLMEANEEGTLAALKAIRRELTDPMIAQHHGRVVKTTGDGVLVEFASVVDAVRCAVEVQHAMTERNADVQPERRIGFRIGINLGDVIVDEGDIYGDGVNIAARLEGLAEPGGIYVSGVVRDQVGDRLDVAFDDLGEEQVKNISRPIHVFRAQPRDMPPQPRDGSFSTHADRLTLPDQPSIAVLPFQNMSSDPEQEFFADGIAEDVITALSRYPSLFVIARNSSFTYKGRAVDVKQVGRELGVRYVLEGSLRKAGERVRVTAQLVEAESGNHLWAERYDRGFADIFAVQDEITEAVTIAVAPAIARAEMQRAMRKRPENLDVWAVYQRGLWHASRATANDSTAAISCFKDAISRDPNFASAYAELYWAYASASLWFHTHDFSTAVASMDFAARSAVALDGGDAGARAALGNLLLLSAKKNDALLQNERALAISPNLAVAHFSYGCTLIYSGHSEEGLAAFNRYLRLDRFDLALFAALSMMAIGHYFCREYEKAADAARQAIHQYPAIPLTHRMLAQSLGQLGRTEEAREALTNAVALAPSHLDVYFLNRLPWHRPEDYSHLLEGLRKAGWEG